jgi:hypothetical protein
MPLRPTGSHEPMAVWLLAAQHSSVHPWPCRGRAEQGLEVMMEKSADCSLPFPQRDVHVFTAPDDEEAA